jgi:hypothetical protein
MSVPDSRDVIPFFPSAQTTALAFDPMPRTRLPSQRKTQMSISG